MWQKLSSFISLSRIFNLFQLKILDICEGDEMDEDEDIFEAENLPDYAKTYALPRRMTRRKSQETMEPEILAKIIFIISTFLCILLIRLSRVLD